MPKITLQINSWNKLARFLPRHLPPKDAGLIVVIKSRRRYQPKNIHTAGGFPYHSLFLRNYSATKYGTSCKTVVSCSRGWDEPWHSYTSSVFILIEFLNLLFLVRLKIALPSSWAPRLFHPAQLSYQRLGRGFGFNSFLTSCYHLLVQ